MSLNRKLKGDATIWGAINDGYGGFIYDAPFTLPARWETKNELFIDISGEQVVSRAIVYLEGPTTFNIGDFIFNGTSLSSDPVASAERIRQLGVIPNLKGTRSVVKVYI